ncbi:hypothetical protein B0H66DRAFT_600459 [Apodospora peruviana]|uniref:GDP/GTP exchange factor Sec2 N-terminal domain-containing protein n=1 Tax=Apodospora peruviana TaxID=516989 RepID=A0AAE0IJK4_9PEZI|nr:hypothetical protein B0H66DRAFT_600459 [Apodospora peruviana]
MTIGGGKSDGSATHVLTTAPCCPKCGSDLGLPAFEETQAALLDAHNKINDLQAQVRLLNQKASAAVDRWADYEDELAKVRSQLDSQQQQQQQSPPQITTPLATPSPARSSFLPAGAATRLSAFLSPRISGTKSPSPATPPPPPSVNGLGSPFYPFSPAIPLSPTPSTDDLMEALSREQALRLEAEGRLSDTSREVEELSVTLFEQANEMVANERRARAKLEERVETLEKRDHDKKKRLERLESAMGRIERVRTLLGQVETTSTAAPTGAGAGDSGRREHRGERGTAN